MTTYPTDWDVRQEGDDDGGPLEEVAAAFGILPATLARWRAKGATSLRPFPGPIVKTQGEAAKRLNVNRRTICDWIDAGCPGEPGQYHVGAMATWRREQPNPDKWSDPSPCRWKSPQGATADALRLSFRGHRWGLFTALCDVLKVVRLAVPTMDADEWAALEESLSERLLVEALSDRQIDRYITETLGGRWQSGDDDDDADGEG